MTSKLDQLTSWLKERKITEVECLISDLTGIAFDHERDQRLVGDVSELLDRLGSNGGGRGLVDVVDGGEVARPVRADDHGVDATDHCCVTWTRSNP